MSPEQAVGGTATPASDRYALAVVAFELLTGRRPYVGESFASEAAAHATAPIPAATTLDGSLPGAIDVVFERGLAKAPEDRFRSCGELVASLTGVFSESAGATVRLLPDDGRPRRCRPRAGKVHRTFRMGRLLALGTLALLGILAAAILTRDGSRPAALVTVMRTATVAGKPQVRTVTVEGQPAAAAPPR